MATLLAALGTVAAHLPRGRGQEGLSLPSLTLRLSRPLRFLAYPLVIALTLLLAWAIVMAERGAPGSQRLVKLTLQQYQEMARLDPSLLSWPEPHLHLGKAHFLRGETEEARKEYEEALRLDGSFAPARLELAHLLRAKGDLEQAMRGYREVVFSLGPGTAPLGGAPPVGGAHPPGLPTRGVCLAGGGSGAGILGGAEEP